MGGSQMFLNVGDKVKFIELIKGVASVSANDGAVAIAEFLAGSEEAFAQKMNEKASALGLKNTHFVNSNGLPGEGQMTCAMDMALLGFHYVHDYPEALQYHSLPFFEYRGIKQKNWNALLTMDSRVDGLKTGYLSKVGYHVLFSAKQDNLRFIGAVMGAQTSRGRDRDAVKLIEYGFNSFTTITFAKKGDVVAKVPVSRGKIHEVDLLADKSMFVSVRKGTEKKTPLKKEIPSSAAAPIKKGDVLGKLIVEGDGFPKTEVNLVAAVDVPLKSYRVFYMAGAVLIGVIVALAVWKFRPPPKRKW
jgi:D-alanyl-D-alanine carboxypeptidase (penicillin-binding protein 5/6)